MKTRRLPRALAACIPAIALLAALATGCDAGSLEGQIAFLDADGEELDSALFTCGVADAYLDRNALNLGPIVGVASHDLLVEAWADDCVGLPSALGLRRIQLLYSDSSLGLFGFELDEDGGGGAVLDGNSFDDVAGTAIDASLPGDPRGLGSSYQLSLDNIAMVLSEEACDCSSVELRNIEASGQITRDGLPD